jgi:hypothetical protein
VAFSIKKYTIHLGKMQDRKMHKVLMKKIAKSVQNAKFRPIAPVSGRSIIPQNCGFVNRQNAQKKSPSEEGERITAA